MKILFVADDFRVLDAIAREPRADGWTLEGTPSGRAALARLDAARFDVVVADVALPDLGGAAVLDEVRRRHPKIVRIILSGPRDGDAAMRAARVAHQFLAKPCTARGLTSVVERTVALQQLLADDTIRAAVGTLDQLPSAPRVFAELTEALEREDSTPDRITQIVGKDPAISAKLLQVVNSAFFSRGRPIQDLRTSVVRLGVNTIRNLALAFSVFASSRKVALPKTLTLEDLQEKALRVAKLAGRIAKPADAAEAFLAGLLADVGLLALATAAPGVLAQACAVASASDTRLYDAERSFHDVTHAEIGAYVLGTWGLGCTMVEAVANHHAPRRIAQEGLGVAASVYLAMALIESDALDEELVGRWGTSADLARWREMATEV